ncbi:MAG: hypothetical protein Q4A82_01120 [Corynebacterium sp.]|nr:hypothetical protein [Corynebacterium sp.]
MTQPVLLIADGGEMTVGRRTAVYTYGSFDVRLPEGREQANGQDERIQNGYIYRPNNLPQGRFDIAFVRADVKIDLEAQTTDLETVIDAAQKRVEGDVFFERDITNAGIGRWTPGVDFTTGDIVSVLVWGKTLQLPVTAMDMITNADSDIGWRIHVGGQLISDPEALRIHNSELRSAVETERRRRLRDAQRLGGEITTAKQTAGTALHQASTAVIRATTATETANTAKQRAESAVSAATQARQSADAAITRADKARADAAVALSDTAKYSTQISQALSNTLTAQTTVDGIVQEFSQVKKDNEAAQNRAIDLNNRAIQALNQASRDHSSAITALDSANAKQSDAIRLNNQAIDALNQASHDHSSAITALNQINTKQDEVLTKVARATEINDSAINRINSFSLRIWNVVNEVTAWNGYLEIRNEAWEYRSRITAQGTWTGNIIAIISFSNRPPLIRAYNVTKTERSWIEGRLLGAIESTTVIYQVITENE